MSFEAEIKAQADILVQIGRSLDTRGYAVMVDRMNRCGDDKRFLHNHLTYAIPRVFRDLGSNLGIRTPPIITVFPGGGGHMTPQSWVDLHQSGKVFDFPFAFVLTLAAIKQFMPIIAACEIMGATQKGRHGPVKGDGIFHVVRTSSDVHISGQDRDVLTALLHILNMPHHRECLLKRRKV